MLTSKRHSMVLKNGGGGEGDVCYGSQLGESRVFEKYDVSYTLIF